MTNEQKAKEIATNEALYGDSDNNSKIDECYIAALEMAKWKDSQRRTPSDDTTEGFVHLTIGEVACHETDLQRQIEQGKAFAEHNKTVFDVAMAVATSYLEDIEGKRASLKRLNEENDELRNHIFVLNGRIEKLELDNHSLDQVAKVFQQDLAKKDAEIKKLRERNVALKRQLDESNKQIEIHAKRERELENELEEYNDERNFI
jgi:chromosome segregation ATPase